MNILWTLFSPGEIFILANQKQNSGLSLPEIVTAASTLFLVVATLIYTAHTKKMAKSMTVQSEFMERQLNYIKSQTEAMEKQFKVLSTYSGLVEKQVEIAIKEYELKLRPTFGITLETTMISLASNHAEITFKLLNQGSTTFILYAMKLCFEGKRLGSPQFIKEKNSAVVGIGKQFSKTLHINLPRRFIQNNYKYFVIFGIKDLNDKKQIYCTEKKGI